jgi:hypothetical protein
MFRIIVVPSNSTANAVLFYKTFDAADAVQKNIHNMQKGCSDTSIIVVKDDFGHVLTIDRRNISYALFIDVEKMQAMNESVLPLRVSRPTAAAQKPDILL